MQASIVTNQPTAKLDKCFNETPFDPIVQTDRNIYGSHFVNQSMLYLDQNNIPFEVKFRNHDSFNDFIGGKYAVNKPCEMCGRIYYDLPMMGIPICMKDEVVDGKNVLVVYMEGVFHSFECTYLALKTLKSNMMVVYQSNPIYNQSESILNILFQLAYPGSGTIDESLKTLTVSKYHSYQPTLPNLVLVPLKTSHVIKKDSIC